MPRENNVIILQTKEKKTRFNISQVGEQTEITEVNK